MKRRQGAGRFRAGAALVLALVTLTVLGALVATWIARANARHRQARLAERQAQAALVVEAALDRAQARIAAGSRPDEVWEPPLDGGENSAVAPTALGLHARAETVLKPDESQSGRSLVSVTATLSRADEVLVQHTHQVEVDSPLTRAPDEKGTP